MQSFLAQPGGSFTNVSGGQTGTTPAILKDASWQLGGQFPLTTITWVNRYNNSVTSQAVTGEVEIVVDPASHTAASIGTLVAQNGGSIFAKLPAVGLYWARVTAGQEASFIAALRPLVSDVFPNFAIQQRTLTPPTNFADTGASASPLPVTSGNLVLDDFNTLYCAYACSANVYLLLGPDKHLATDAYGNFKETPNAAQAATHGHIVDYYRTNHNALHQTDTTLTGSTVAESSVNIPSNTVITAYMVNASFAHTFTNLGSMIAGSDAAGLNSVINYSAGPIDCWIQEQCADPRLILPSERDSQTANESFQESFARLLNSNVAGAQNAIIVQAAGNSGTDLTSVLANQHTLHPTAAKQIIQVGALDTQGNIANYSAFSSMPELMIYVPVTGTTDKGAPVAGTSFAAPKIQYLANQIRNSRPDLTPDQIRQVLFDSSVAPMRAVQRPNAPIGETIQINAIENPLDPTVLQTAISIANGLFPTPTFSLTIATIGTGSGTVSKNPPGSTYAAGTAVTLAASPATGSTFTGWSGACSGTGSCVVTVNANKTVTATFTAASILTISTIGTGSGTVSANPPGPNYTAGTTVTLTAAPAAGSTFTGWSGACSGTGSCVVTMNADKTVTATFTTASIIAGSWTGFWSVNNPTQCSGMAGSWRATFTEANGVLSGSWQSSDGSSGSLAGTISGSAATWSAGGSGSGVRFSGTITGSSISGGFTGPNCAIYGPTSGGFGGNKG